MRCADECIAGSIEIADGTPPNHPASDCAERYQGHAGKAPLSSVQKPNACPSSLTFFLWFERMIREGARDRPNQCPHQTTVKVNHFPRHLGPGAFSTVQRDRIPKLHTYIFNDVHGGCNDLIHPRSVHYLAQWQIAGQAEQHIKVGRRPYRPPCRSPTDTCARRLFCHGHRDPSSRDPTYQRVRPAPAGFRNSVGKTDASPPFPHIAGMVGHKLT